MHHTIAETTGGQDCSERIKSGCMLHAAAFGWGGRGGGGGGEDGCEHKFYPQS